MGKGSRRPSRTRRGLRAGPPGRRVPSGPEPRREEPDLLRSATEGPGGVLLAATLAVVGVALAAHFDAMWWLLLAAPCFLALLRIKMAAGREGQAELRDWLRGR